MPVHLFIIGDSDKENFKVNHNFIKDNHLSEFVTIMDSQKNIEQYYRKFNIFVLPSLSESCPNVLFEAMLAKCLCIVSKGANSDQFINDGNNGFVYDGTDQMLKEKLGIAIKTLRSGNEAIILENAQKYVLENFSIYKMLNSYLELYGNLMQYR
jgi:glycosyltransferase involved in cell wall biosynthesis